MNTECQQISFRTVLIRLFPYTFPICYLAQLNCLGLPFAGAPCKIFTARVCEKV